MVSTRRAQQRQDKQVRNTMDKVFDLTTAPNLPALDEFLET